ncbi:unnamed protein product [Allacma fusca]|uniref:Uncharacterized protein n=1 Tax=Allacma fusca TaxID=39272 RepID=A0A8J2JXN1_9HEXA|nr:unnamed protein product [Allacma fusca]
MGLELGEHEELGQGTRHTITCPLDLLTQKLEMMRVNVLLKRILSHPPCLGYHESEAMKDVEQDIQPETATEREPLPGYHSALSGQTKQASDAHIVLIGPIPSSLRLFATIHYPSSLKPSALRCHVP